MSLQHLFVAPADSRDARLAWRLAWVMAAAMSILLLVNLALWPMLQDNLSGQAPRPVSVVVVLCYAIAIAAMCTDQAGVTRAFAGFGLALVAFATLHWLLAAPPVLGAPRLLGWPLISEPWLVVLGLGGSALFIGALPMLSNYRGTVAFSSAAVLLAVGLALAADGVLEIGARTHPASGPLVALELALLAVMTAALYLYGRSQLEPGTSLRAPALVALGMALFTGVVWLGLVSAVTDAERQVSAATARSVAAVAAELVDAQQRPLQRVAVRIAETPAPERAAEFEREARRYLADARGVFAFALYDGEFRPLYEALAFKLDPPGNGLAVDDRARSISRPDDDGAVLGPPLELGDGGRGALLLLSAPTPDGDRLRLVVGLRYDVLLAPLAGQGGFRVLDGPHKVYGAEIAGMPVAVDLAQRVLGRDWQVQAWPIRRALVEGRLLPTLVLVAGLSVSAVMAASMQLASRARRGEAETQRQVARYLAARHALDTTERRIVQALESTSDAVFILDRDWRFTYLNAHAARVLRHDASYLLGRNLWEEFPAARGTEFERAYRATMQQGPAEGFEARYEPLDAWFDVRAYPPPDGVVVYFRDVTSAREAYDRLVRSEQMLARAQQIAHLGGWELDIATNRLAWTDEVYALFGVGREGFDGTFERFLRLVHPDDRDEVLLAKTAVLASDQPFDVQHRTVRPDGSLRWIRQRAAVVRRQDGRPVLSGTAQDVTELVAGRQAVVERDRFFSLSLEMFSISGLDGHYRQVNPSFTRVLGYSAGEMQGRPWLEFVHPEDAERTLEVRTVLQEGERVEQFENRLRCKDGSYRWLSWNVQTAGDLVYAVARDVTDNKRIEAQLQQTLEDLRNRNRELEDFAFVASHDLQEPLRKIRAFSDRLVSGAAPGLDERAQDYLGRIAAAAGRMQRLIDDLLAYSRVTTRARPFKSVDLNASVADALADLEARVEATGASIEVGELPRVQGDETQLRQVMQNLLGNALKFTVPGRLPKITVRAETAAGGDASGGRVTLVVEDNGIGFDPRHVERIFAPFQRLHSRGEYEGSGMGLAIVRRIVERHGGSIQAIGAPGTGAAFRVTLPAAAGARDLHKEGPA